MKPIIYVAGPYSGGPDANNCGWTIENNIRRAENVAFEVWTLGAAALCPHTNTRHFHNALPYETWLEGDMAMLARCDAVILTPDWKKSPGALREKAFADSKGIPCFEYDEEVFDGCNEDGDKIVWLSAWIKDYDSR